MEKIHTTQWIQSLHNPLVWKCLACPSTFREMASQQELANHVERVHARLSDEDKQRLAGADRIPKLRPVDVCPICMEHFKSKSPPSSQQRHDQHQEDPSKSTTAHKELQSSHNEKKARFSVPDSSESESDGTGAYQPAQSQRAAKQQPDHAWTGRHIAKHLKSLAFFFSNRLTGDWDKNSNATERSVENLTQLVGSESRRDLDFDPEPRLPDIVRPAVHLRWQELHDLAGFDEFEWIMPEVNSEEGQLDVQCIRENRRELAAAWGGNHRPLEPNMPSKDLELMFPSRSDKNDKFVERDTMYSTSLILIILELCRSTSGIEDWVLEQCFEDLRLFSKALDSLRHSTKPDSLKNDLFLVSSPSVPKAPFYLSRYPRKLANSRC